MREPTLTLPLVENETPKKGQLATALTPSMAGSVSPLTPMRAIRKKCRDCCCDQVKEVQLCTVTRCALWPYRMGRRPKVAE